MFQIDKHTKQLTELCENNSVVEKLYFFGSVLSPKFDKSSSDIDILIEVADLPPEDRGEGLISLWDNLESLFNRKVDLLTIDSLRNPVFKKEVEQTKKLFYDRHSSDKASKYLSDIQYAISMIEHFTEGIESFSTYQSDLKTQSAVERQLGMIGEAVSKYGEEKNAKVFNHAVQIVNFRNRMIFSYDHVEASIVWIILNNHLPLFKQEVNELLNI